uniref:Uncharacterized protein n=1 Tax=Panagrolaimus sp. ES5 TaxID=591445 RepID=A0AC34G0S2_9BILA
MTTNDYRLLSKNIIDDSSSVKERKKKVFKNDKTSSINKSTLSLHIAAYEDLVHLKPLDGENTYEKDERMKSSLIKKLKHAFSESANENPFEFPRTQEGDTVADPEVMQFKASQKLLDPHGMTFGNLDFQQLPIGFGSSGSGENIGIDMAQLNKVMKKMTGVPSPNSPMITRVVFSDAVLATPLNALVWDQREMNILIVPFLMGNPLTRVGHFTIGAFFLQGVRRCFFLDSLHRPPHELFTKCKTKMERIYGHFDLASHEECNSLCHLQENNPFCATYAFKNVEELYFRGTARLMDPFKIADETKRLNMILNDEYIGWPDTLQEEYEKMNEFKKVWDKITKK